MSIKEQARSVLDGIDSALDYYGEQIDGIVLPSMPLPSELRSIDVVKDVISELLILFHKLTEYSMKIKMLNYKILRYLPELRKTSLRSVDKSLGSLVHDMEKKKDALEQLKFVLFDLQTNLKEEIGTLKILAYRSKIENL